MTIILRERIKWYKIKYTPPPLSSSYLLAEVGGGGGGGGGAVIEWRLCERTDRVRSRN